MSNEDIAALVATLPAEIRSAVERQDDEAFQSAFSSLSEDEQLKVAQVFQQLQASMANNLLADFEEDDLP
ncbi:MAG TPA: hypothetical protein VD886_09950, partial [Herpetosiphonaceae bacterium]|nr:hypothetical protein [Herpetosiphonaceae bacterium]